jgi:hypothetical protein
MLKITRVARAACNPTQAYGSLPPAELQRSIETIAQKWTKGRKSFSFVVVETIYVSGCRTKKRLA